ncbi:hypothetical protein KJ966_07300 [bacterium]|nr:hypothetical protein [bacterium]
MKKLVFLFAATFLVVSVGVSQESGMESCFQSYQGQLAKGYNALAIAVDNGFYVCGFAFGSFDKGSAAQKAITECETIRLDPVNEVQGKRKVMTHCRIHRFQLVE